MAELKRPETIPGYQHPTQMTYSRRGIYKTFSEGKKVKKKEKFGKTTVGKHYATLGDKDEELCPVCENPPTFTFTCPCAYSDKRCAENHIWYTDRDGEVHIGDPHLSK